MLNDKTGASLVLKDQSVSSTHSQNDCELSTPHDEENSAELLQGCNNFDCQDTLNNYDVNNNVKISYIDCEP